MSAGTEGWDKHRKVQSSDVGWSGSVFNWLTRMMSLSSSRMAKESLADAWQLWEFESVDCKVGVDGI